MVLSTILILINLILCILVGVMWIKVHAKEQEDPRLSKGLRLLQSKISILEDLSDSTEKQTRSLIDLMHSHYKRVHDKIEESKAQIFKIEQSMVKSMEVAEIFQDKIPHSEIINRQKTKTYSQASQLAYKGCSVEDIMSQTGLPKGEVEFIEKINKNNPRFAEEQLFKSSIGEIDTVETVNPVNMMAYQQPESNLESLHEIGEQFRAACEDYEQKKQSQHT